VFIDIAWLFGYPISQLLHILSDKVDDNKTSVVTTNHPVVIHFIRLTSGVILGTFSVLFMSLIATAVGSDRGEEDIASAFSHVGSLILVVGIVMFPSCYGFYFNKNIEKIVAKYEKEVINEEKRMNKEYYHNHHYDVNRPVLIDDNTV
jgi:hypothetical protein